MTKPATFETLRAIVAEKQSTRIRWPDETGRGMLCDLFTASRIVSVHSAVNDANKTKLERMISKDRASFVRVVKLVMT